MATTDSCLTDYGCYTHWWMALPALPAQRDVLDWWATPDGRCTPYRRLKRLWFDYTRLLRPADNPGRPHEFARPTHSTQMIPRAWENLVLLHPSQWLPRLLSAASLPCPTVDDCCWSYEFEAMVGRTARYKQADVTIHARGSDGDMLVIVEAKRPGDKLKENCDLPDTDPLSYLDLDAFRSFDRRFLIYLVDDGYVPVVRSKVRGSAGRWGIVTWLQLLNLQTELVRAAFPSAFAEFAAAVITDCHRGLGRGRSDGAPSGPRFDAQGLALLADSSLPSHAKSYVAGSLQYLAFRRGVRPDSLAFGYLATEPSFQDVHRTPAGARQLTSERRSALWRLPPRARSQPFLPVGMSRPEAGRHA
ncbi:MAG TPA: hypothetical protein VEA69_25435 [Tepidisphaeraceae bacterium]|nr:hypothetical protein [Tepidisphaeraceae bacterium]